MNKVIQIESLNQLKNLDQIQQSRPDSEPSILLVKNLENTLSKMAFSQFISLYKKAFTGAEYEQPSELRDRLTAKPSNLPHANLIVFGTNLSNLNLMQVYGGIFFEYYQESCCGLLLYIVVAPEHRKKGIAKRLVTEARMALKKIAQSSDRHLKAIFADTKGSIPRQSKQEQIEILARLKILSRLGAKWIDIPFFHPPFGLKTAPFGGFILLNFPELLSHPFFLERKTIVSFLDEYYRSFGIEKPHRNSHFQLMCDRLLKLSQGYRDELVPLKNLKAAMNLTAWDKIWLLAVGAK
jgi:GNAT superfamily N-acetyltransferase